MAAGNGIISAPVSRFQRTTHSARFIKNQLNQQMKASLVAEAKASQPDTTAIATQLGELDVHAGDKQLMQQGINSNLTAFNSKFSENPFYAFSKEGRGQLGAISNILNNPKNQQFVDSKIRDDDTLKIASDNGTTNQIQIRGNQIKVIDVTTGRSDWINIDDFNENKDRFAPLTVAEDYSYTAKRGSANSKDFSVSMSNFNDILTKASTLFDKVGSTKETTLSVNGKALLSLTKDSNASQMSQALAYLTDNGLTQDDINTLVSMEYSANPNQTYAQARLKAISSLQNLAESKIDNEVSRSASKNPNAPSGDGEGGLPGVVGLTVPNRVLYGEENDHFWNFSASTGNINDTSVSKFATNGTSLDPVLDIGTKTFKNDDGIIVPNREVMKNSSFRGVITTGMSNGNIMYVNENGDLVKAPDSIFRDAVILSDGEDVPLKIMYLINPSTKQLATTQEMKDYTAFLQVKQENNNAAPPASLNKYLIPAVNNAGEQGSTYNIQPALAFTAMIQVDDNNNLADGVEEKLRNDGVQITGSWATRGNVNNDIMERTYQYIENNTQQTPRSGSFGDGANNNIALPRIIVPIPDYEQFATQFGAETFSSKQSFASQSGDSFGANTIFISTGSRSDNSTISNQVKGKNLPTFE